MEKAFVQSETNAHFFFDLLSKEPGFSDSSLDGAYAEEMNGAPAGAAAKPKTEKDNKIQGREVIAAAFNKITHYYPKITEHFKQLGLDLAAMLGPDGQIKAEFIAAARQRLLGEGSADKAKTLDFLAAQFLIAEQNGVSNKDPLFLEKWETFSKLPEADRKAQVKAFLAKPENAAKFVRWSFRLSELSLLPFKDQVDILKEWGIGEAPAKSALSPLWQDRGLPKMVAQAALLKGLDLEEAAKSLSGDDAKAKQGEARLLFRAAAELDNENPLARRRLAIYLVREGKLSSAGFHIGIAIQNETELRYILENVAGLEKQDKRLYAPAPDAYTFAAEQLGQAKRHAEAAQVYSEAANAANARGDSAANAAFIEKKLAAEELAKPFEILFTDKNNPVAARLYQALRAQGIPSSLVEGALTNDRKISAKEVISYFDQNWKDEKVQKALKSLGFPALPWEAPGAKLPYDTEDFRKLGVSGKMVAWHVYDIAELKKHEPVDWKEVARHQRFVSYYDPENSARKTELGDALLSGRDYPGAAAVFEEAFSEGGSKDFGLKTKAGMAYFGAGEFEKSRAAYSAFLEKNPKDPQGLALRHEATKMLLESTDPKKDPKKYQELSAAVGADYAMLLTVKPEDEKAKLKEIETAIAGLHDNKGDQAKIVARLAGIKDTEQAGGITKREVIASVEGLAQNYLQLAEQSYSDPKDVEAVRAGMNALAAETFGMLARFAKEDSDPEISKMTVIYESYQLIAEGKLDEAVEKLKPVEKIPEAARVLANIEKGRLRLYNTAALEVWERHNQDMEQTETDESKGLWSGRSTSTSDVKTKFELEHGLTAAVRLKLETGEAHSLKEALTQISTDGEEKFRERAKFLLSPAALAQNESAIGDIIDYVSQLPATMERSQKILKKAWSLESQGRGLNAALGLYGLVEGVAEEDFMKDRAKQGLDALQGNATFGRSFEKFLSMSNSGNLAVDIGLMFVAAGLGNVAKLRMLARLEKAGVSGYKAVILAGGVGLTTEVTALWGANTLKETLFTDPSKVFTASHLAKSYGATLIMIGGLKGFGKVGGNLGPKAAKSLNLMAEGGTQLSRGGKVLVWSFGHGFGMGGMVATSHINQGLGLTPKPIGGWKEGLVHDVLGYVQFAVAHGAADRVFSGKMQEVSMRQHNAIAYKESILLAKGHADVMGFKAEALKVTVDKEGKLSVDGKPIEEFEAADKARIEGLLVKDKKGEVKDQTVLIDGSSRRLLVTLMTDAGLNRPGFSGLSLRRMVQDKKFAEANAYLQKHSVPLRFGKAGEVFAMGSQPGSPHALLGIDGKVEPVTDAQVKDLTPEPAPKPTKKVPPPPPPSKKQRKAKAKKKEAGEDSSTEDSPLIAARKGLPAPAAKTDSSPPPSGGSSPSTPRALPPPLPKRPLALPPVPVNEHTWAEKFASRGETDFAGKETMFRDGYNALNERVRTDPRFADPKFRAEMENTFTSTLDALRPILERTPEGEARTHLGQALFINVMQGKLTLADARELTAGALAGHYRVEKSPGWEYRCAVLYHGAEVPAGASLLVGKSGKNFQAIQGEGLVQATLADKTTVNFEFRQQDAKTTAIFEGRPGAARVEILDPASQKYRPLKDGERFEVQDGEAVLLGGDPFVFRSAESVAKETHQRQALLQERNELFHLRSEASQMIYGTDAWRAQALKVRKRRDAFDQLLKQEARNANGSSAIEGELLGLVSSLTPFAPAARKALKGELSPAEYRAAQTKIASPLVESHRNALEEVESYLNGLYADEFLEHRISTQIRDEAGKALENPHVRLKDPADVAPKLARRGWVAMEPMTDYAGARIVVKNTNDALAIAADIEKNLPVRDAFDGNGKPEKQEKDILGQEYKGGTETMEVTVKKDKDHPDRVLVGSESGYRALHIVVEIEGKPVEIQIQTESIFKWGKIQHSLIYKGKNSLPAETHKVLNEYCRDVAAYLTALEEGVKTDIPRPQEPQLPADLPSQLKNEIQTDLNRMSELMKYYHKLAEDESQVKTRIFKLENVDGAPKKPVSDEEVTKRYKIIQEPGDKSGVPERRGAAGGAKVVDLTGLSDSKSAPVAAKPSELRFSNGKVMTLAAESKVAILGTKDSAELRLKGPEIAAEHAEIIRDSKSRCVLRPLHGNSVKVLRDGRWIDLSKDGKAEGHELATGDKIRIGGSEFTWKSSPRLEQTGAEPAVPPRKPVPPPLPTVEAQFRKHSEVLQGKGTDLVNLLEISDRTLSGETTEWSPSFINVSMPDTAHIPVSSQFHRLTLVEFTEAKAKGELRDTAPLAYTLQIRGKQRAADLEARLRAEYGALLTADPKGGDGWVLRNPLGQAQVRIRFETKDLNVPSPVEARKVYEDFEKNSLQQLESWFRDETSGLTLENSYAFRMLQAVGPAADGKGGVRFGASFAEAVRRYETETNPVKKAQAGEQLATLCAIVKDAPARIREFKVTQEILRTLRNSELVGGLARARESGGPLAREAEIATEALKTLSLWENELRRLGEMLRRQVKIEDRKEGNPQFDAYKQKEDQILQSLNALRGFGKQLEDAGFKRKGPPPLPAAKKDIQGASDLPSQDLRSFDAATLDSLQKLGVANVEKLKDAEGPEYAQTLVSGMDHLLKQAPNGHVNHEMMLIRMINGLREWEKRSGQRLEWLEGYLQGFRRDRFGVPLDIPSAVTTPPERLSLSLEDQKRLNVTEVNPRNVLAVVEAIRTTTPQLDKIGGFSAFRLAPANEQLLFRILQNYGPYIQHKRPELGAYLHALFEVRSVYAADMEGGTPSGEPGTGKIPERRDGAAAKKADSSGDPLGFRYVEEISTNGLLGRELYTLAHPKPSLNKVIPGLTREMEMQFERGAQVRKWPTTGQFMIAETPSGSDTQVIRPATPVEVEAYRQWKDRRGFAPIPQAQARQAWKALEARAKALGIILYEGADLTRGPLRGEALEKFVRENGGQIAQVKELLDLLPASFFASGKLKRIFFKSPRQEDAHFSAYDAANGSLYLYAGAFNGSRRNLAGLFLHEAGHANAVRYRSNHEGDSQIPMTVRQDIALAHHVIVQQKALFALDWAGGKAERLRMQEKSLEEFLADVQLAYVAAGPELRAHYRSLPVGSAERRAWDYLYAELSDRVFGGLEFEYNNRPSSPPPVPPRVAFDQRPTLKYIPGGKSAPAEKSKSVPPPPSGKSATAKDPGPLPTRIEVPASYLQKAEGPAQKVESLNWGGIAAGRDPGFGPKATNNEDRYSIGSFNLPDGTHVVRSFVIDGMGGQGQGKGEFAGVFIRYVVEEASKHPKMNLEDAITMADRQLMEHPTHRQIAKEFGLDKAPGAVVVGMETRSLGNDEYQVKFAHVGDSEGFLMDSHFNVDAQAYTTREPITNRVLPRGLTLFSRINPFRNGVDQALGSRQEGKIDLRVDTADHKAKKGTIAVLGSDGLFENFIGKSEMSEVLQASGAKTARQMQKTLLNEALMRMYVFDRFKAEGRLGQAITHQDFAAAYQAIWGAPPPAGKWRYEGMILESSGLVTDPRIDPAHDHAKGIRGSFKRDHVTVLVQVLGERVTSKAEEENGFLPGVLPPASAFAAPEPSPVLKRLMELKP